MVEADGSPHMGQATYAARPLSSKFRDIFGKFRPIFRRARSGRAWFASELAPVFRNKKTADERNCSGADLNIRRQIRSRGHSSTGSNSTRTNRRSRGTEQTMFGGAKMAGAGVVKLSAAAIATVVLTISPSAFKVASASAQQLSDDKPMATSEPVALFIRLCPWSQQRPAVCREVPLNPGAAGPGFASMKSCLDGQEEAVLKWREQAGPVFGFTAMAGDGYRIEDIHCGPLLRSSSHGS
jgi:hypothetical protein